MNLSKPITLSLRTVALGYLIILVVVPIATIIYRTFQPGFGTFWSWITTPAAISALQTSLLIVIITVPLNVIFGIVVSLALARGDFPGKGLLHAIVDLPFAVSPIIVGVALILLWGVDGWFGGVGFQVIFALPGMVIATIFVTLPFIVREVEPVLKEIGTEQEQAAITLGASAWQTFFLITLPAIRWGRSAVSLGRTRVRGSGLGWPGLLRWSSPREAAQGWEPAPGLPDRQPAAFPSPPDRRAGEKVSWLLLGDVICDFYRHPPRR